MRGVLRRLIGASREEPDRGAVVRLAGLELHDLAPAASSGASLTKVGRLSLIGRTDAGARIKIVEANSPAHARLLGRLAIGALADILPRVLGIEGRLVVSEWVPGGSGTAASSTEQLVRVLARIHAQPLPAVDAESGDWGFDYLEDLVLPRARRAASAVGRTARLERILEEAVPPTRHTRLLSHPDATSDNLVHRSGGGPVLVDNELLGVGWTPALDLANLARGSRDGRMTALRSYLDAGGRDFTADDLASARTLWLARLVGSHFVAGDLPRVQALLDRDIDLLRLPFEAGRPGR